MESPNVKIYFDPDSVTNHNPSFGSLECGARIDMDFDTSQGYSVIAPKHNPEYFKIMELIHGSNPIFCYLKSNLHFKSNPSIMQKIFRFKDNPIRNCAGCTTIITSNICSICSTKATDNNFYTYAHNIDKNISESDTTYITLTTLPAIKNAVSLVCQMIDDISNIRCNAFALVRPPGHHASEIKSEGFCIVNNIAIAAEYAIKSNFFKKIFIFDFDAHHGNGTQTIFYKRSDVFYCSMHTVEAYPRTGSAYDDGEDAGYGYNLNVIVEYGISSNEYLSLFDCKVAEAISGFKPDLILVSAGFDGLGTDPIGIMNLKVETYGQITKRLVGYGAPVGMILEGGYDLDNIGECIDVCLREL